MVASGGLPLDGAADRGYLLARPLARQRNLLHRFEQIAADIGRRRLFPAFIEPPAIVQFELAVEAEEVGRAGCAIGPRDQIASIGCSIKWKAA